LDFNIRISCPPPYLFITYRFSHAQIAAFVQSKATEKAIMTLTTQNIYLFLLKNGPFLATFAEKAGIFANFY